MYIVTKHSYDGGDVLGIFEARYDAFICASEYEYITGYECNIAWQIATPASVVTDVSNQLTYRVPIEQLSNDVQLQINNRRNDIRKCQEQAKKRLDLINAEQTHKRTMELDEKFKAKMHSRLHN